MVWGARQLWLGRDERKAAERAAAALARKAANYQAWQVVDTVQGKGGSGGRIDALQDLVANGVSLAGVRLDGAWLEGIQLEGAKIAGVRHAPPGWRDWVLARGAMDGEPAEQLPTSGQPSSHHGSRQRAPSRAINSSATTGPQLPAG